MRTDIARLIRASQLLAVPSKIEGLPLNVLEAMMLGTPVIASAVGGIPEVINNENIGVLINPNNYVELANEIIVLLSNPEKAREIAEKAHDEALRRFIPEIMIEKIEKIYNALIKKKQ